MCITLPGRVIGFDGEDAVVEVAGRIRRASRLVVPDVQPGDWVIVGSGAVLRRLDPDEAAAISSSIGTARDRSAAPASAGGPR